MVRAESPTRTWLTVRVALIIIVVAGLAIDAYVHFDLASNFDPIKTSTLSQGDLFRIEGVVSIVAALLLLVRPRRWTAAIAALVAGSAFGVLLLYRYVDVGRLGPIPSMYEPVWYTQKTVAAIAEGIALVAALVLLVIPWGPPASHRR
jgi:hypothetical protein